jgi:hypothetical protein
MTDLWEDEGFGSGGSSDADAEDDWEGGDESIELALEEGFDDPDETEDEDWDDGSDG